MGLLRFMLAMAVVSGHASGIFGHVIYPIVFGSVAVQLFYMISGFLIALILDGKYADTPQGNWIFYSNRAVKIFVPYLAILVATVLICLVFYEVTGNAVSLQPLFDEASKMGLGAWLYAIITNIFLIGQEWGSMLLYRNGELFFSVFAVENCPCAQQFTVIVPSWTLSLELMFYLIAPFILRRHFVVIAAIALASYLFRFRAYAWGYHSFATDYRFFPFELSLFLYGALSYRFYLFLKARSLLKPGLSFGLTVVCALITIKLPRYLTLNPHQFYALMGFMLPALFDFSTRHRWDKWLGDLSYPLYLVHWPVGAFAFALLRPWLPDTFDKGALYPYLVVIISIGLAIAINHILVYSVDRWRQARATGKDHNNAAYPIEGSCAQTG